MHSGYLFILLLLSSILLSIIIIKMLLPRQNNNKEFPTLAVNIYANLLYNYITNSPTISRL